MQFRVTGMTCAACSARVEKAVSSLAGVDVCSVNLLTNSLQVEGPVTADAVMAAVQRAGYGIVPAETTAEQTVSEDMPKDDGVQRLVHRLIPSAIFLLLLMYVSMGHTMIELPLPSFLSDYPVALGVVQMLLCIIVMVINQSFFIKGVTTLAHGSPNMDTLVALGSSSAFVYSTYVLFTMIVGGVEASVGMHDLYFESGAMILTLVTLGKALETRSKGRTTDALRGLMALSPRTATIWTGEGEQTVPIERVQVGMIFVVRPGDSIPVDGVVLEGESAVDESALTGESVPVDKTVGDAVFSASINRSGYLRCRAIRVGEETTLSQIVKMVEDAAATKAPIAKLADKVAGVFVPVVGSIALITLLVWLLLKYPLGFAVARAVSVLVISCPCALALATPMAIMVGNGLGARHGILFKTAAAMEQMGRVRIVALDKTGTITAGHPQVTDICPTGSKEDLLRTALALEQYSEHPLGTAICDYGKERGWTAESVDDFSVYPGNGLMAAINGYTAVGGNIEFVSQYTTISIEWEQKAQHLSEDGKTPMFFALNGRLLGIIAVADTVKEDSVAAVQELKQMGIRVVMLTGDNARTATAIGRQIGIDEVVSNVLPQDKEAQVRRLMEMGPTAMVGDGINDAPALTAANIGVAIGAGTDIAVDAADVVVMNSRLSDVVAALRLGRATLRKIRTNLFWAFFYNAIGIPLAAGVFVPLGITLNPMFGAAAMCLSSFCVMTNTLRLNRVRLYPEHSCRECEIHHHKEEKEMQKIIKVDGMMCPHCEAHVKEALEALEGVESVVASHVEKTVTVTLSADVEDAVLHSTIEAKGYKVME